MYQKTIKNEIQFNGVGVHTGKPSFITLKPAKANSGISFFSNNQKIELDINNIVVSPLCTTLSNNGVSIKTVEHLLSSIYGLGITNLEIHIKGEEVPIMDGSSYIFSKSVSDNIIEQNELIETIKIKNMIHYSNGDKFIIALPYEGLRINYFIDYGNNLPFFMSHKYIHSNDNYINEISKARTFGNIKDYEYLKLNNLANGSDLINTLVIENNKYLSELNYYNEPVRHKILDFLGDLCFLGKRLNADIYAFKTGHKEHLEFVKSLLLI